MKRLESKLKQKMEDELADTRQKHEDLKKADLADRDLFEQKLATKHHVHLQQVEEAAQRRIDQMRDFLEEERKSLENRAR
jgi:hypothetical protein